MTLDPMWAKGVDVSHYQPIRDNAALVASGVCFVGVKATEGNTVLDDMLKRNQVACRVAKFDLTIYYHYARSGDPVKQAERLMAAVGDLLPNERLCLDIEQRGLPAEGSKVLAWVDAFYERLWREYPLGGQLIYTSKNAWALFGDPDWDRASYVDLWAPRYSTDGSEPKLPRPWLSSGWKIWQWTDGGDTGIVHNTPGVGHCDANVFHGTREDLLKWLALDMTADRFFALAKEFVDDLGDSSVGKLDALIGGKVDGSSAIKDALMKRLGR